MINISINISGDNFETVDHNLNRLVERLSCVRRVETVLINSDTTLGAPTTQDAADEAAVSVPETEHTAAKRERGKPAPGSGRARRTKAEIAEDEAAEAGKPQISTGENRVGPQDEPEDSGDNAQDAADEAAEVARGAADQATSTIEDVRAAAAEYVKTFGMDAAQADGGAILQAALGAPPAGEQIWKMSIIPAGMHGRVVAAFNEALAKNPFQRDVV